MKTMEPKFRFC